MKIVIKLHPNYGGISTSMFHSVTDEIEKINDFVIRHPDDNITVEITGHIEPFHLNLLKHK